MGQIIPPMMLPCEERRFSPANLLKPTSSLQKRRRSFSWTQPTGSISILARQNTPSQIWPHRSGSPSRQVGTISAGTRSCRMRMTGPHFPPTQPGPSLYRTMRLSALSFDPHEDPLPPSVRSSETALRFTSTSTRIFSL